MEKTDKQSELQHFSVSQVKTFQRCALQYRYAYIEKIKKPIKIGMVIGSAGHKALENNFKYKKDNMQDMRTADVLDIYDTNYEIGLKSDEIDWGKEEKDKAKDSGYNVLKKYHKEQCVHIFPVQVERNFEITFENVDYTVKGYIDLITSAKSVMDYKFVRMAQRLEDYDYDPQLLCYGLGYQALTGEQPASLQYDFLIRTNIPKLQSLVVGAEQRKYHYFLKLLGKIGEAIRSGIFYPNGDVKTACSWCGYSQECRNGTW